MKKIIAFTALAIANFIVSSFIYIKSFVSQAIPYLSEEQGLEVSNLVFQITVPAFAVSSIVFALIAYFIAKKFN